MKIAIARQKTSKKWRTVEMSWEQFLGKLRDPHRTAETMREYKAMSKADRDAAKEAAGGFVGGALNSGQRKTENVTERSLITLDADNAKARAWQRVTVLHDFRMEFSHVFHFFFGQFKEKVCRFRFLRLPGCCQVDICVCVL